MWNKMELFNMSVNFASHMPLIYHLEFVRIAADILRIENLRSR